MSLLHGSSTFFMERKVEKLLPIYYKKIGNNEYLISNCLCRFIILNDEEMKSVSMQKKMLLNNDFIDKYSRWVRKRDFVGNEMCTTFYTPSIRFERFDVKITRKKNENDVEEIYKILLNEQFCNKENGLEDVIKKSNYIIFDT